MFIVYRRTCSITGKSYIGYTSKTAERRWNNGKGYGAVMGAAIAKYGVDAWEHEVLSRHKTEQTALKWEAVWIRRLGTVTPGGYNVLPTGTTNPMHCEHSLEKMRRTRMGQYTEAQRAANRAKRGKGVSWILGDKNPMKRAEVKEKVLKHLRGRKCEWLQGEKHHMQPGNALAQAHAEKIRGRITINNGIVCRMVAVEDALLLLEVGWARGQLRKSR